MEGIRHKCTYNMCRLYILYSASKSQRQIFSKKYLCVGWLVGWLAGWMDGWMDGNCLHALQTKHDVVCVKQGVTICCHLVSISFSLYRNDVYDDFGYFIITRRRIV